MKNKFGGVNFLVLHLYQISNSANRKKQFYDKKY